MSDLDNLLKSRGYSLLTNASLPGYYQLKKDSKALLVLANFSLVSSLAHLDFFDLLIEKGWAVAAFDYPGLGLNTDSSSVARAFDIGSLNKLCKDFAELIQQLNALIEGRPLYRRNGVKPLDLSMGI